MPRAPSSAGPWPVAVPESAHGLDQGLLCPRLRELLAQVADVELRAGARAADRVAPDELEELLVGEHLVRVADEDGEELELERRQLGLVPADGDLTLGEVDGHEPVAVRRRLLAPGARAPQQGL